MRDTGRRDSLVGRSALRAVLLLCGLGWAAPMAAQQSSASVGGLPQAAKQAEAVRLPGEGIRVDGLLDEEVWRRVRWVSDFTQKDPVEGAPATVLSEVAFVFDGDALYVGARLTSNGPDDIRAQVSRRDNPANSERLIVSLDTYYDRRTAYSFGVTATGVRFEYYHSSDSEFNRDQSFNPVWQAEARRDSTGWTAEMRIPFSQLRFNDRAMQRWGLNINRYMPTRNEDVYWVQIPKNETGWASRFGELTGIEGVRPSRRLELLPYVATNSTLTGNRAQDDPFDNGVNLNGRVGGDVKMGLGPNLTLDATINPDFGQVEADPAEVNLSAVETFFSERRPFFTEGSRLLQGNGNSFFYSRRIGAPPRGSASGDYVDRPQAATILGAAKMTGRLASGTSIGTLVAVTDREEARTFDVATGTTGRTQVAPLAGYGVARVQQEFGASQSTVGATFTTVQRDVERGTPLGDLLTREAYTGGVDWVLRFQGGAYELGGSAGLSHVRGEPAAIRRLQENATHYFQRPDQDHVSFDSTRTSMTGYAASLYFDKNSGTHWLYSARIGLESPGFEINDAGRIGTADDIDAFAYVRYRETQPGKHFRNYNVSLYGFTGWNFGGVRQFGGLDLEAGFTFKNFWETFLSVERFPSSLRDNLTRGGPLMRSSSDWNINGGIFSPRSSSTRVRTFLIYGEDDLGGLFFEASSGVAIRPSSRWELSVDPTYSRSRNTRQYISQKANGPAATFGTRYVFGTVDRTTISARFRLNYSISPDLSLELYAEPFAASGQYKDVGELSRPRTSDLRLYGTDGSTLVTDPDDGSFTVTDGADSFTLSPNFNVLSFRSNLVLRWEWRPGSTLFLVWQQNRFGQADLTRRASLRGLWNSVSAEGDNFLALKISYWIPVS